MREEWRHETEREGHDSVEKRDPGSGSMDRE
jgi:hypothetical protein